MTENEVKKKAEILTQKIKHYLITLMGRTLKEADNREFFHALSYAIREEVMINWAATLRSMHQQMVRRIYYLSMEYLPGRLLANHLSNLHAHHVVKLVVKNLQRDYREILNLEPDPGLGNGGLGRLASCLLDSMATQNYPAMAYGLRYQYGIFEQQIWDGVQVEKPDCWLLNENPWEFRRDLRSQTVKYAGYAKTHLNRNGEEVADLYDFEEVRALPFDYPIVGYCESHDFPVITLRLWSTKESPRNFQLQRYNAGQIGPAAENTALTDVLYPNDNNETGKRIRLKQEFLLVAASLQDILRRHLKSYPDFSNFADKVRIQINDTHPALIVAELIRQLTKGHDVPWNIAFEMTQEVVGYTNHTILSEALEEWNQERVAYLLPRQYTIIEKLNAALCSEARKKFNGDEQKVRSLSMIEGGQIKMSHLAVYGSHKVNGVARLHGEILKKKIFKEFYELYPEKFTYVTNGISQRHWLFHCNPILARFLEERIGIGWVRDFSQMSKLQNFAADPRTLNAFLEIKKKNKERLINWIKRECVEHDLYGHPQPFDLMLETDSLFDVQVKRIHEYKRQLMNALNVIMIYHDLLENVKSRPTKRTVIFGGKAAAGYLIAKNIIHLICLIARKVNHDPAIAGKLKVLFIENYCVSRAEVILPAAELSEQISTAGMEASGTGNMKLAVNGALTIGTEDGSNIEMREEIKDQWWPFSFGARVGELDELRATNHYHPWDIYSKNPKIKRAVDTFKDGTFAKSESEAEALSSLYDSLLTGFGGQSPDKYFVLKDLESYYQTQKKVEEAYLDQNKWAEITLHNMSGMGRFSSDVSVRNYAKEIWDITPFQIDKEILESVRQEYTILTF